MLQMNYFTASNACLLNQSERKKKESEKIGAVRGIAKVATNGKNRKKYTTVYNSQ